MLLMAATVIAEETKKEEPSRVVPTVTTPAVKRGTPIALTVEGLQEMEDRKTALDAREAELNERAKALDIQEKILKDKLKRMEELNTKMAEKLDTFKKDHDSRVAKLVTMVETMKPQAAASYIEQLDPDLAVEILARINVTRAAKILNLVDKTKSARLTELYTGYRQSIDPPAAAPSAEKKEDATAPKKM
jgi:flagellar motility protein MotE (MotC chaperone)